MITTITEDTLKMVYLMVMESNLALTIHSKVNFIEDFAKKDFSKMINSSTAGTSITTLFMVKESLYSLMERDIKVALREDK